MQSEYEELLKLIDIKYESLEGPEGHAFTFIRDYSVICQHKKFIK
jgi:hypothetical protein